MDHPPTKKARTDGGSDVPPTKGPYPSTVAHIPTVNQIISDNLTKISLEYWVKSGTENNTLKPFDASIIETIYYKELNVRQRISRIMLLELSFYLENYLWPNFDANSSFAHAMSIVLMVNEKFREGVPAWHPFRSSNSFSVFFRRVLDMYLQHKTMRMREKTDLIIFFINCFQSLEDDMVRKECSRLLSLKVWHSVTPGRRQQEFTKFPRVQKMWKKLLKKEKTGGDGEQQGTGKKRKASEMESSSSSASTNAIDHEKAFIAMLIDDFLKVLWSVHDPTTLTVTMSRPVAEKIRFCERFIELVIDLMSQLSTRRFLRVLLSDKHFVIQAKRAPIIKDKNGSLLKQLLGMLKFYEGFEINDFTGEALTDEEMLKFHYEKMKKLQQEAFKRFQPELRRFALSNIGAVDTRQGLHEHLEHLSDEQLVQLAQLLNLYEAQDENEENDRLVPHDRSFLIELITNAHERRQSQIQKLNRDPLYPDEKLLWDTHRVPDDRFYAFGDKCLGIPKLNIQFLTFHDYFLRNYKLFRLESTYEIRADIEDVIRRAQPRSTSQGVVFEGWARLGAAIEEFKLVKVMDPLIGSHVPAKVKAEVIFTIPNRAQPRGRNYTDELKDEWDSLRQFDVLFLVSVLPPPPTVPNVKSAEQLIQEQEEQQQEEEMNQDDKEEELENVEPRDVEPEDFAEEEKKKQQEKQEEEEEEEDQKESQLNHPFITKYGVVSIRGCEIVEVLDEDGKIISDPNPDKKPPRISGRKRTLKILLDPAQYQRDVEKEIKGFTKHVPTVGTQVNSAGKSGSTVIPPIYKGFNFIIRRRAKENNFKAVLETIRDIMNTKLKIPDWLHNVFLGYGDPNACYNTSTPISTIDFNDTFTSTEHVTASFPGRNFLFNDARESEGVQLQKKEGERLFYKIHFPELINSSNSKTPPPAATTTTTGTTTTTTTASTLPSLVVTSYTLPNMGPYPQNIPKTNTVPFTPVQVNAIKQAVNTGLTMVVGPPGTGKTDVAVQIINNWYHNFPQQRTLIITHSNQALNQIFEKIMHLDIDERHLLRLGHGQEQLETEKDFSKFGRVNYMLQLRIDLLKKVEQLAAAMKMNENVAYTCETAQNFFVYYVLAQWEEFQDKIAEIREKGEKAMNVVEERVVRKILVEKDEEDDAENNKEGDKPQEQQDQQAPQQPQTEAPNAEKQPDSILEPEKAKEAEKPQQQQQPGQQQQEEEDDDEEEEEMEDEDVIEIRKRRAAKEQAAAKKQDDTDAMVVDTSTIEQVITRKIGVVEKHFPFIDFFSDLPNLFSASFEADVIVAEGCFRYIRSIFDQLADCRAFELLKSSYDRGNYLLMKQAKIIAMTCTHAALKRRELINLGFKYDNILMEEAAQILEIETFIPLLLQQQDPEAPPRLKRIVLIGDHNQLPPVVKNMAIQKYGHLDQSLFTRFVRLGVPTLELDQQGRARSSIAQLYNWRYTRLGDLPHVLTATEYHLANPGFFYDYQVINVEDFNGRGESTPNPFFYQNLGEAEYLSCVYAYMISLGYPPAKISVLTSYNGQKHLLRDVLRRKCATHRIPMPHKITTVDRYQGQQNDYVLLSLVRTKNVGHIRDIRRLVVAMSRARLGLYVFCRKSLFANCYELTKSFAKFLARNDKLMLVRDEIFPATRKVSDTIPPEQIFQVEDVTHMQGLMGSIVVYQQQQQQLLQSQQAQQQQNYHRQPPRQHRHHQHQHQSSQQQNRGGRGGGRGGRGGNRNN